MQMSMLNKESIDQIFEPWFNRELLYIFHVFDVCGTLYGTLDREP